LKRQPHLTMTGTSTPKESGARTLVDFLLVRARFYDGARCAKVGLLCAAPRQRAVKGELRRFLQHLFNDLRL
jgi:hypothetical protein